MADIPTGSFEHALEEIDAAVSEVESTKGTETSLTAAIEEIAGTSATTAAQSAVSTAIGALDASSKGGTGKYIKEISETDGVISATAETMDTTPTASSTKAVTSGGVKTYVDAETTARQAECNVLANAGAKNLCPYNTASVAVANRAAIDDQPINLSAGTYIISYTQTATSGSSSIKFSYNGTSVVTFPISNDSTPEKEAEFTLPSAANQIKIFTNVVNSYSNIMIRRKEITDATYQPYAPTNRELYEMILAMQ